MRKSIYICCTILVTLMVLFSGCGKIGQSSPAETVKAFYMAANEGQYSEVEKYMCSRARKGWAAWKTGFSPAFFLHGRKGVISKSTRNGMIERLDILKIDYKDLHTIGGIFRGKGARVDFIIHYKDGKTKKDWELLIKEKGVWKITVG